ncbi:hypothetical protein C8R46DRAFT_1231951 [Mycena filopes]|nr:hypothetical protein C8R46DRAFT_1231951 [Mycena filopes]
MSSIPWWPCTFLRTCSCAVDIALHRETRAFKFTGTLYPIHIYPLVAGSQCTPMLVLITTPPSLQNAASAPVVCFIWVSFIITHHPRIHLATGGYVCINIAQGNDPFPDPLLFARVADFTQMGYSPKMRAAWMI